MEEEKPEVLVAEKGQEERNSRGIQHSPRTLSHVLLSNIYFIFQREIAGDTPFD